MAPSAAQAPRTLRVVVDRAYAPFSFLSDEGKLQGIVIDQWAAWEKKTGIKVEIQAADLSEALRRMRAGEFDVIDNIVETPERRAYFDFTPPYATVDASIFFRREVSGIADLASLKGFPVGVKAGDQHIDKLLESGVTTVIPFQNFGDMIDAARRRKINVFMVDAPAALYLLNKMGIEGDYRYTAPVFRDELRRAVQKGDAALLRTVSEGFAGLAPGDLRKIDEKWLGYPIEAHRRYLNYAASAAALAILFLAALVAWNRALRKGMLQRSVALSESEHAVRASAVQLQALSRRLVELQESERRRLSRELHDRVGQTLTATRINMDMIRRRLAEHDDPVIRERNDDSLVLIESAFKAIENVMYELRPAMIDQFGPIVALQWYAKKFTHRTGIRVEVRGREDWRCAPEIELSLFRIAQEALNNVARHAQARQVTIELRATDEEIELKIEDDGIGFDAKAGGAGKGRFGFITMSERSEALGGTFGVGSTMGKGTRITVTVPRRP
jgi:signal transduction histidine kinase